MTPRTAAGTKRPAARSPGGSRKAEQTGPSGRAAALPLRDVVLDETHRLIPTRVSPDGGGTVLARLSTDPTTLGHLQELDDATNDRFRGEDGLHAGIAYDELLFGSRYAHIVNAAFTHPSPLGGRFSSPNRGAWYASLDRPTALAEFAFHRQRHLAEIRWTEPETSLVDDYRVAVQTAVHDLRPPTPRGLAGRLRGLLQGGPIPACYARPQELAATLLAEGSEGLVYPSVRHPGGACLVLFRPTRLAGVRRASRLELTLRADQPFHPGEARELSPDDRP